MSQPPPRRQPEPRSALRQITGSSRGIGAAIARSFARQGATVVIHGRDIAAVRDEIEGSGGKALSASADVLRFAELESLREHVEREAGPIDILVANAGGSFTNPGTPFEDLTEEGWHASVDGNLTATFLTIKSVLRGMKERRWPRAGSRGS